MYEEDEYLMISGLQHFKFCRRQWDLIHIEQQWAENERTTDGFLFHKNAHDSEKHEKRGNKIIMRGLKVKSSVMGVYGICDVVEFCKDDNGVELFGYSGKWLPIPIEYKSGEPKENNADKLQLCCQAMCLEEMLLCNISVGYLFYGKTKRRTEVIFSDELRDNVRKNLLEMHDYFKRGYTPKTKKIKGCAACSLIDLCIPSLQKNKPIDKYIDEVLKKDEKTS